ncbi:serine/threonine-protein kinase [Streptomyces odontomachi]|uniref:serine/threonine-protein kinase n=1 Tax=Streptomyces odontomachi TaxID=2944940 RepID=UPI00210D1C40|nr:serine/threonine-protein kinase [Streptomyces sp. ODS25]
MTNDRGGHPNEPTSYGLRPPQPPAGGPVPQQGGPYAPGAGAYDPTQATQDGRGGEQAAGGQGSPDQRAQGQGHPGYPPSVAYGAPTQVSGAPQEQRVIGGRYQLTARLGHGGMGTVWVGRDLVVKREVAIKEPRLPDNLTQAERQTAYQRMEREAQAAARIDHPSVVTMHDVVVEDGKPWVVMELVRGQSLADRLQEGTLDPREAAQIGLAVAGALQAAHGAGVLHRDVKPDNVLLGQGGRVVLTDFGIAQVEGEQRLTETGAFVGSPEFISPERVLGQRPGPASDLWSLGVVLYAAVEGMSPFRRSHTPATLQAVLSAEPQAPARAGGPMSMLIMQLLRKDPMARPSAAEVRQSLESVAHVALPPTQVYPGASGSASAGGNRWVPPVLQGNRKAQYGLGAGVIVVALALVLLLLDPFGGGGLPKNWETRPEPETVGATIAVPHGYHRDPNDDNSGVTFYDPSGVFHIYVEKVDNSQKDPSTDDIIKPDGWAAYYRKGGENQTEMSNEKVSSKKVDFHGTTAYDTSVNYTDPTDTDEPPFRYFYHQIVIPKDGTKDSKVYWRLQVSMPGEGWAHPVGEQLYQDAVDNLEIDGL